jgi:eukaryotic-like serine/threonine-protein kinase
VQVGTIVGGRYAIARLLGEGGMGAVYEARHATTGRRVALKVIAKEIASKPEVVARFELEARATGAIESEHVAQVLDVDHDEALGVSFLVMEFLEGRDLEAAIEEHGVLPPEVVLRVGREACLGLQKAHAQGILHRDIKPANIFLAERDQGQIRVKLLDFGIAKVFGEAADEPPSPKLTRTGMIVGSPLYMSPEQARGSKDLGVTADLWSLGVTLFHAISGDTPLAPTDTIGALLVTLCTVPPPPVRERAPWVSEPVAAIIDRALRMNPEERWPGAREMGEAIAALLPDASPLTRDQFVTGAPATTAAVELTQHRSVTVPGEPVGDLGTSAAHAPTGAAPAGPTKLSSQGAPVRGATVLDVPQVSSAHTGETAPPTRAGSRSRAGLALGAAGVVAFVGAMGFFALRSASDEDVAATPGSVAVSTRAVSAPPRAPTTPASASSRASASHLAELVGRWETESGRDFDAVLVGDTVEFRVVDPKDFPKERYALGEPRFILRALEGTTREFALEDRARPAVVMRFATGSSPSSCLLALESVAGTPLRAQLVDGVLNFKVAIVQTTDDQFQVRDDAVVGCQGLDRPGTVRTTQASKLSRR